MGAVRHPERLDGRDTRIHQPVMIHIQHRHRFEARHLQHGSGILLVPLPVLFPGHSRNQKDKGTGILGIQAVHQRIQRPVIGGIHRIGESPQGHPQRHIVAGTLKELLLIAVGSAFVNNVVLSQFLGICPFLGVSKNVKTAAGMGGAVVFVITIASFVTGLIYKFILGNPNIMGGELSYLNTIVFILVIAALVQFVEMFLKKAMPSLYNALGVYLPLITTNCAVLGVALTNVQNGYYDDMSAGMGLLTGVVNGFATAVGFLVSIVLMAGIREKIEYNDISESFQGTPIVLVTAGLMAIAFFGFSGLI